MHHQIVTPEANIPLSAAVAWNRAAKDTKSKSTTSLPAKTRPPNTWTSKIARSGRTAKKGLPIAKYKERQTALGEVLILSLKLGDRKTRTRPKIKQSQIVYIDQSGSADVNAVKLGNEKDEAAMAKTTSQKISHEYFDATNVVHVLNNDNISNDSKKKAILSG